jgi:FAD/FMN-containing dehydrogenase
VSSSPSEPAGDTVATVLPGLRRAAAGALAAPAFAADGSVEELLRIATRLAAATLARSGGTQITDLATPLTPTEAAVVCTHLLDEVDLDLFELAMWKNWGRA